MLIVCIKISKYALKSVLCNRFTIFTLLTAFELHNTTNGTKLSHYLKL